MTNKCTHLKKRTFGIYLIKIVLGMVWYCKYKIYVQLRSVLYFSNLIWDLSHNNKKINVRLNASHKPYRSLLYDIPSYVCPLHKEKHS